MTVLRSRSTPIARIVTAVLAAAAAAPVVMAQDSSGLEEVLVTATRHGLTDLQKTPIAVTAIGSEDIARLVARDISAISADVPDLRIAHHRIQRRLVRDRGGIGLTDIIVYLDSPVAVNIDDFVTPSVQTQLLDTFDIDRVEVLRGPQGTLFGKIDRRPGERHDQEAPARRIGRRGARTVRQLQSLPGAGRNKRTDRRDTFAVRGAVSYNKSDGY